MPASNDYTDNVVDLKVLRELVGTDWINESVLYKSGVIALDSRPLPSGTFSVAVRNQMFEAEDEGIALGIGTSLSSKERKQVEISHPIIRRGNVGLLDDIQGEIQAGGPEDMGRVSEEIRRAASTYLDTAIIKALEGAAAANTSGQTGDGSIISLSSLNTAKYLRGDKSEGFQNGFWMLRANVMQTLVGLGLVAQTSNTFGVQGQNTIVLEGMAPKLLGMGFIVTDKLNQPDATDEYMYALERGSIIVRGNLNPIISSHEVEDGFGTKIKFRISFSAGVKGMKWAGSQQDIYTNAELATSTNWSVGALSYKHIPVTRLKTDDA